MCGFEKRLQQRPNTSVQRKRAVFKPLLESSLATLIERIHKSILASLALKEELDGGEKGVRSEIRLGDYFHSNYLMGKVS